MESTNRVDPALTVIVPAMRGYDTVRAALDAWDAQTCRARLEIVILCPDAEHVRDSVSPGSVALATGALRLHEARALGIRQARAAYVTLAEDHCLPDPRWAERVLARIAEGWDAVGPALRPGNTTTSAQASFLLGYGEWMQPVGGGPTDVLPGHNVTLARTPLLERGAQLESELLVAAFLLQQVRRQGARFFLEEGARMRHFDRPDAWTTLLVFGCVGLGFGAIRTQRWSWPGRAAYPVAAPAVAVRHWLRGFQQYRRAGRLAGLTPLCLVASIPFAIAWAVGEAAGALLGVERVTPHIWRAEVKPVTRAEVE